MPVRLHPEFPFLWSSDGDEVMGWLGGYSARTGADGTCELPFAPFGVRCRLDPRARLQPDDLRPIVVTPDRPVVDVVVRFDDEDADPPASLLVGVESASAPVQLDEVSGALLLPDDDWAVAWAHGRPLRFCRVPPGRYRLRITAKNAPMWEGAVEVDPARRPTRTRVVVGGRETISGRVVDDRGLGIAGARVSWTERRTGTYPGPGGEAQVTGPGGEFRIFGLTAASYRLQALHDRHARGAVVEASAPANETRLVLTRTGDVEVHVKAREGEVLPKTFRWRWERRRSVDYADCVDGRVVFRGLAAGRQRLEVFPSEPTGPQTVLPIVLDVDVRPRETVQAGPVELDPGVSVSGLVLAPDGTPAALTGVFAWVGDCPSSSYSGTDPDGRFTLAALPRGPVVLVADRGTAGAQLPIDTTRPRENLTLQLVESRRVRVEVTPWRSALGDAVVVRESARGATRDAFPSSLLPYFGRTRHGEIDRRGVTFLRLPPGDWTLRAVGRQDDALFGSVDVTVPATGDSPLRVSFPIR